jgi:predicted CDP-diglyceride synthetase/phosphatidate cytidylyltransferase
MLLFFAPTTAFAPAAFAPAAGIMALVASARLIDRLLHHYRGSDIVEQLGKRVRSWRGIIVVVTSRVAGVARQVVRIVGLSESRTGSKTVVSLPAPTRHNEGYPQT